MVKLHPTAMLPTRATPGSVGYDLYANHDLYLGPGPSFGLVGTGVAVSASSNFYAKIESRSGLARHGVVVQAGILDPDHTGEVGVLLYNFSRDPHRVRIGDRIAQLVCYRHAIPVLYQVDRLEETFRGAGSFGSTGR